MQRILCQRPPLPAPAPAAGKRQAAAAATESGTDGRSDGSG
uniref:Uncharacterized protein n=1 Tax=Macrostomum lignano TaxID=282301 RepID=A0A1I8F260_9PLAT